MLLEVAIDNVDDGVTAHAAGADRLEVVTHLHLEGLSAQPSVIGRLAAAVPVPLMAMVRPRAGNFVATPSEVKLMCLQAADAIAAGASGLVMGMLKENGELDACAIASVIQAGQGAWAKEARPGHVNLVFHRAFDFCLSPMAAVTQLARMGFTRILTAGCTGWSVPRVGEGFDARCLRLASYRAAAGGAIEIMPGGGVRPNNLATLLERTGAVSVHSACRGAAGQGGNLAVDTGMVREMKRMLSRFPQNETQPLQFPNRVVG